VSDPQNLGAILRSSLFFGAKGVVVCSRNSAPLSPVASKCSSGALEQVPIFHTRNVSEFLLACSQERGWSDGQETKWRTVGFVSWLHLLPFHIPAAFLIAFLTAGDDLI
jgi:hypothetical protein